MAPINWLDRVIASVAPSAGLKRVRARATLDAVTRAYAGAAFGRHTEGWRAGATSADAEIFLTGNLLRDRARELVRNNPHAAKGVTAWVNNLIGDGILPRPNTGDAKKDAKVKAAFETWSKECDADGIQDFFGMQTLACREMVESGEILSRRRRRLPKDGYKVPLQIQLLEADFLDSTRHGWMATKNTAISGIEFNFIGQPQAYWLFPTHPGNNFADIRSSLLSAPVPASEIVHLFEKQRTQARGVTWLAPVMRTLRDLDDYEFAELIRKKMEASVVGIVTNDDPAEDSVGVPAVVDSNGRVIEKFSPGMFAYARGGKDIKFNSPATVGGYAEYKKSTLRTAAAGFRLPYELLSGDLSDVNFSSIRAGIVEFRRLVSATQWHVIIPMLLQPWWDWFTEAAYLAGVIDDPVVPVEWQTPKFSWVDPYKDALAELLALRAGTRSYQDVIGEHGRDWKDVIAEIKAWNDLLDKNEITVDSDPRRTSMKGVMQKLTAPQDPESLDGPPGSPDAPQAANSDDGMQTALRELSETMRAMGQPVVNVRTPDVKVTVPVTMPARGKEVTRVTQHDEKGRILEFERQEVAEK